MSLYVFDTNVFIQLGFYYPSQFPTIWKRVEDLVVSGNIISVREVKNELERGNASIDIEKWVKSNRQVFKIPSNKELEIVTNILSDKTFNGLVRRENILKGLPVADPFIIASAKVREGIVVTQENFKPNAARIPTVCKALDVECINLQEFFVREKLKY